ncbi:transcriptional regulator [Metabacillus sp. GX 13764]|uniref:transcriptional regulator SplA domain-containing protein n=1 Tax=Metabacillus kandeliae TaxID=2900151 RepID=UPI001E34FBA5|nr:transcriptional regulator SplA domain-containing protein [Metabacillus kandeliae]MCD7036100.1 transcriptional regulator [Metabacillus kandeliae]
MLEKQQLKDGDKVFVIYRNPHAANVATIEQAEIVPHPKDKSDLALFIHNSYHPLTEDDAIFASYQDAEYLYNELFDYQQYD